MKILDILNAKTTLDKIGGTTFMKSIVNYKVGKNIKIFAEIVEEFNEFRNEIIIKYGFEDNGVFKVTQDNMEVFSKEINEFAMQDVDVKINKIRVEDLVVLEIVDGEKIGVGAFSGIELNSISFMIEEE